MSAYIVNTEHAIYLVHAMARYQMHHIGQPLAYACSEELAAVTNDLLQENYKSVHYRYEGRHIDELDEVTAADMNRYVFRFEPVEVIKAVECYQYQACEHEGWETSKARTMTNQLKSAAISRLEGYDAAPWGCPQPVTTRA